MIYNVNYFLNIFFAMENRFASEARVIIKTELTMRRVTYRALSEKLAEIGVIESESQLKSKIFRGTFSFYFFIQVMRALEMDVFDLRRHSLPRSTMDDNQGRRN